MKKNCSSSKNVVKAKENIGKNILENNFLFIKNNVYFFFIKKEVCLKAF